jgi:hypothetical protein
MDTSRECYQMANQCEQQAALVHNPHARQILLEVAGKWRKLGDELKVREEPTTPSPPRP